MKKIFLLISCITISLLSTSCDKFLDITPEGKIIPVTTDDYRKLLTSAYVLYPEHRALTTLRTDEMQLLIDWDGKHQPYQDIFTFNDKSLSKQTTDFPYDSFYKVIFYSNQTILNGVNTMENGAVKNQLLAEAYGLRAMSFFDLANLYADVYDAAKAGSQSGIVIETEIQIENKKPKSSLKLVYEQIHADINHALELATQNEWTPGLNYRFTKPALYALQARVYEYQKDYENALLAANKALEIKSTLANLNTTNQAVTNFNNVESIMSLELVLPASINGVLLGSSNLVEAFTDSDLRFDYTFKKAGSDYKITKTGESNTNSKVTFRTTELYFIKSEALASLNQVSEAANVISQVIKARYSNEKAEEIINQISSLDKNEFIKFLLDERFKEFAFEGHRWFDLRRLDQKEITHEFDGKVFKLFQNDPRYTLPFPMKALQNNPNL